MRSSLPVLNLAEATFDCTFGRGCDGVCCRNGRPPLYPEEVALLGRHLERILPRLRPEAAAVVKKEGYLSRRRRIGLPMVRVVQGWCLFFNQGCVLHQLGAEEGDKFRYKPCVCALFPLNRHEDGGWFVRQRGYHQEKWDLFCLDPQACAKLAAETLQDEMRLAASFT